MGHPFLDPSRPRYMFPHAVAAHIYHLALYRKNVSTLGVDKPRSCPQRGHHVRMERDECMIITYCDTY